MKQIIYFSLAGLLLLLAYIVFRIIVRRDYSTQGRLSALASSLQLLVFAGFFSFPYVYNPPEWAYFWMVGSAQSRSLYIAGLVLTSLGFLAAFGTMAWFGLGRAFGLRVEGLKKSGPYGWSRNPQILGGYLLVIGIALQWPSLFSLGWILLYAIIGHWMVTTEEEHLHRVFGEEYAAYCSQVPRYLLPRWKRDRSSG